STINRRTRGNKEYRFSFYCDRVSGPPTSPIEVFALSLNYEHSPTPTPDNIRLSAHDRHIANHSKSNTTTPLAQLSLSSKGISDREGSRSIDRGSAQARAERSKGCSRYLTRLSTWIAGARALLAAVVADRSEEWSPTRQ